MKFTVLTLFPEILRAYFESSIMAKAVQKGIIACDLVNIRDFALDKHHKCDDSPYGAGAGQLMLTEPLDRALKSVNAGRKRVVYLTPSGKPFTQKKAQELSSLDEIVFICGRYEGIDQRIIDFYVDDEISIGDYVLTGGELPAMVVIDCVSRFIPGVLGSSESTEEESFSDWGLLEYPQYTRPANFRGREVPPVLLNGNHAEILRWRRQEALKKTKQMRPDLLERANLTAADKKYLQSLENE